MFGVGLNSVRLACVRHAASVRPEPGSNSLKYGIKSAHAVLIYFRAFVLLIKSSIRFAHLSGSFSRVPGKLVSGSTHSCKWSSQNFTGPSFLALFNFQGPGPLPLYREEDS